MAGQTPRFALNFFGGDTPGSLVDDNDKYTGEDRLTIDRLLTALENHNHHVSANLDAPDEELDLLLGTVGTLEAGATYFYVISFVNTDGLETVCGPEASIETPELLVAPDPPEAETGTAAGALTAGQYYYALTALRVGEESPLGTPAAVTVLQDEHIVTLTLPDLDEATSYQVWRKKDTDPQWTRVATTATATLIDDGSVPASLYGDPGNIAPTANTGVDKYSVTISLTGVDITSMATSSGWRIYRSDVSGAYGAASLVHEVIEREDDVDPESPLLTSWVDDGDAPLTGSPKLFSSELTIGPFTFEEIDPLPATTGYPQNYPILDATGLWVNKSGTWTSISGSQRGIGVFTGTGAPTVMPTGALTGDLYIDLTNGDLYTL